MSRRSTYFGFLHLTLISLMFLSVGFSPSRWHCADGRPCDVATLVSCCCGCGETDGQSLHRCEDSLDGDHLTAADCGCFRRQLTLDVSTTKATWLPDRTPPAPLPVRWELPATEPEVFRAVSAAAHGPPRYLSTSSDPRGPPIA